MMAMSLASSEELCAKVILALVGEREITIIEQFSYGLFPKYDVHGSVPGGAYARLQTLARDNPGQLQRLCDTAVRKLPWFGTYRDSQSRVTVSCWDIRSVLEHFQKCVKEYTAARVILALTDQDGVTIQQSTGWEKAVSSTTELAGAGAYEHLREMAHEEPVHLQKLLERAESLLRGAEQDTVWRDGESKTAVTVNSGSVLNVCRDLQELLHRRGMAAKFILGLNNESGITVRRYMFDIYVVEGEMSGEEAHSLLMKMVDDNPTHLHSLLETAETSLLKEEMKCFYIDFESVFLSATEVLDVCGDLQRVLMRRRRRNVAANVILYLSTEGRNIPQPLGGQVDIPQAVEGAYVHLIEMAAVDPTHLQCLLERAKPYLQKAEGKGLTWRESVSGGQHPATCTTEDVWRVYHYLQREVDLAAKVILAIAGQSEFITQPSSGVEEIVSAKGELACQGAYDHLRKMSHETPTHLRSLLDSTEPVLLCSDAQQVWKDGTSGVCIDALFIQRVWDGLLQLCNEQEVKKSQRKSDLAAQLLLGCIGRRAVRIGSLPSKDAIVFGRDQDGEGGETYTKLKEWAQKNPKHTCRLLRAGKSLLKDSPSDKEWRDRSSTTHLTVDDLETVYEELFEIQDKWQKLALKLGVPLKVVDRIKASNPNDASCLRETVKEWLTESPEPSWQNLVGALQSPTVEEYQLASKLEEKYCHPKAVRLKKDDLCTVHTELYPARFKWYDLGLRLGLSVAILDWIQQRFSIHSDCLLEVLKHWLRSSSLHTWEDVCVALRSRTVGEHPLAEELEEVYGPVDESGAKDEASSGGTQSGCENLCPSELREPLLAIMRELQAMAETGQQQGERRMEPSTSLDKDECQVTPSDSSSSLLSSSDHSSDQECSSPPVNWELEAKLLALKEGLARMQPQKAGRQQSTGDCERRHGTPSVKFLSDSPGPSSGPSPGPVGTYLSSSDGGPTLSDQEHSPRTCRGLKEERRAEMSDRKRSAGGHVITEGTPPAKHFKMDIHSTSTLHNTAPKLSGTQSAASGQGTPQYTRLFTQFAKLIATLGDMTRAEDLADKLLSDGLITKGCWEQACVRGVANSEKIRPLMNSVLSKVELNPANYVKFVSVLSEFNGLQDIVQMISV